MEKHNWQPHITIKDIAKQLGLSHSTVSRALNDSPLITPETKRLVHAKAQSLGYIPNAVARMMRDSQSRLVGFIVPDIENQFYSRAAKILAERAAAEALQLLIAISDEDPQRELRHVMELREARAVGIVITPCAKLKPETASLLNSVPTLQMIRQHPLIESDIVVVNDPGAMHLSTNHLIGLGHTRIAFIGGGSETLSTGQDRLIGFQRAVSEAGIKKLCHMQFGLPRPEFGYEATCNALALPDRPTAIVLGSSQLTVGVLRAIRQAGLRVPTDISLIGYGDSDWFSQWGAGITTIALPVDKIAAHAADFLSSNATTKLPTHNQAKACKSGRYSFAATLIQRGSSAAPA